MKHYFSTKVKVIIILALLIAVGLTPEQELVAHLGDVPWLHLCGNCHRVQPMVEAVAQEGKLAGITAGGNL